MSQMPICKNPVAIQEIEKMAEKMEIRLFSDLKSKIEAMNQVIPYVLDFESNNKCAGSCAYCYSSSTTLTETMHSRERVLELIDEVYDLGVRVVSWGGGDPLQHPNWVEFIRYSGDKGMTNYISTAGLISKAQAKQIFELLDCLDSVGHHLDTINQEAYNRSHTDPKTLELKMQGYYNLLEAGVPQDKISPCLTVTRQMAETIEETLDWLVDEMGATNILFPVFKPEGMGKGGSHMEPSLSLTRKALEYRAKKLGEKWINTGASDAGEVVCRTNFGICYNGDVVPCVTLRKPVGNIYQESIAKIMDKHRDTLLYNFAVKGPCGAECENSDICFGCRVTAYHYLGDVEASDPKCFMNTEAQEYYMEKNITR